MLTSTIFNQSINEIGIEETMKREVCKILADVLSDALQSADDDQRDHRHRELGAAAGNSAGRPQP